MPELTVVVPTFNERDNIGVLIGRLDEVLEGHDWEVIFVDDNSPDGTANEVRMFAQRDRRVRCLERVGRRGLATACIEGMMSSSAPFVAVMDGDLQHDEKLLPKMMDAFERDGIDLVIGSRLVEGGNTGPRDRRRKALSSFATLLSRIVVPSDLRDPMSGYFMIRRNVLDTTAARLSGTGYKILLDLLASSPRPLQYVELPYRFGERRHGESKLDSLVIWEYLMLLVDKTIGRFVPTRLIFFSLVGGSGVFVHFLILTVAFNQLNLGFLAAQSVATISAMTSNFFINNVLTYRDRRLRGLGVLWGLFSFYLLCGFGAIANVGVANFVFERDYTWWVSGLAGILVGTVWNYAATSIFTWRK